jgi:hypothetical protein
MQTIWGALVQPDPDHPSQVIAGNPPSKFRIAASFKDSSGKIVKCAPSAREVGCVKGGGNYAQIRPAAIVQASLTSGVALQSTLVTYQSGYMENSIATLVQTSGGGRATIFISTIKDNPPNDIQMSLLDSNSGWGTGPASADIK